MKAPAKDGDEERLRIEAAQKDPSRFADLYEDNFERIYAFVIRRVRDRAHAQDLTSEVFHQALKNLPRFQWRGVPFSAWLLKIASNAITDNSRRTSRERELPAPEDPGGEALEDVEARARLFKLVDRLPADQRRVIVMRFTQQKTTREISRELQRSEGAVKQLQFRALQSLRARLGDFNG